MAMASMMDLLYPLSTHDAVGQHFLITGRPVFALDKCIGIAICKFKFPSGDVLPMDFQCWSESDSSGSLHSEYLIVQRLQETEKKTSSQVEMFSLYSCYSPCSKCCMLLTAFLNNRPFCKLYLAFSSIFQDRQEEHCIALRMLNEHPQVSSLDVFKEEDWQLLALRGNLHLSSADLQWMWHYDSFWRHRLQQILQADSKYPNSECSANSMQVPVKSNMIHKIPALMDIKPCFQGKIKKRRKHKIGVAKLQIKILRSQLPQNQPLVVKKALKRKITWNKIMQLKKKKAQLAILRSEQGRKEQEQLLG